MTREFSVYLDFVRILAAGLVLQSHTNLRTLSLAVPPGSQYGHTAVIVFFVLSGYVISFTTDVKERHARQYIVNRIARIASVAIPALLLSPVLDAMGQWLAPQVYAGQTTHGHVWLRVLASVGLMNEVWGLSIQPFSNAPFWSISYEGWYYILFGLFTFYGGRYRWLVLGLASLLCGPKILLLFPVWLMGVSLQRSEAFGRIDRYQGVVLFVLSIVLLVAYHVLDGENRFRNVVAMWVGKEFQLEWMTYSGQFLGDYVLGAIVTLNFAAFKASSMLLGGWLLRAEMLVRWAAGFTLSLYLFHRPLLLFFGALLRGSPANPWFLVQTVVLVLVTVVGLGMLTERQRHRARALVDACYGAVRRVAHHRRSAFVTQ